MFKFAAATLLCSAGLALCAETAQAGCCRRSACCTPAPTCCAPAASTCAPAAPATAPTAPPADYAPPAPTTSTNSGDPSVAMSPNGDRQTYRSYSADPNAAALTAAPAPTTPRRPASNFFSAGRKMQGIR